MHFSDITNQAVVCPHKKAKFESCLNVGRIDGTDTTGENRKVSRKSVDTPTPQRPKLFPHFLHRTSYNTPGIALDQVPPINLGTRLEQVFQVIQWLRYDMPLTEVNQDLLLLLPEHPSMTRQALLGFVQREAAYHLDKFRSTRSVDGSLHLEAYCIILFWMDQFSSIVNTLIQEQKNMPWFCIAQFKTEDNAPEDLKENVNKIISSSSDVLVCATLLVAAGYPSEAVDFLLDHDHVDEALLLARLRLDPEAAWAIVGRCMKLKPKQSEMGDVFYANEIYDLGFTGQTKLHSIEHCGPLLRLPGSRVKLLALCWVQLGIEAVGGDDILSAQIRTVLQLAFVCLLVGFQFAGEDWPSRQERYFNKWKLAVQKPSTLWPIPSLGITCFESLLNTALLLSGALNDSDYVDSNARPRLGNRTNRFLHALDQMVLNRELTNQWPTCLTYLAVDLTSCLALCRGPTCADDNDDDDTNKPVDDGDENHNAIDEETRFKRVRRSLRACWIMNPKKSDPLILHLRNAAGLLSPDDWRLFHKLSELIPRSAVDETSD